MRIYPTNFTVIDRTPFTYFLRHKITGKMYYGSRTAKGCGPEDLWTKYFTSSKLIKEVISLEGSSIFEFRIARIFNSKDHCIEHETKFLTRMNACINTNWYNLHNGGRKFTATGLLQTKETRLKRAKSRTGQKLSELTRQKIAASRKGKTFSTLTKMKMAASAKLRSKTNPSSAETRKKISIAMKNRMLSGEVRSKISASLKGRKRSPESVAKSITTKARLKSVI